MATGETGDATPQSDGDLKRTLYRYRSPIAVVLAVALTVGLLAWLDSIAVPLAEAQVLRDGSAAVTGGEMTYNAYEGLWLAVRALLGIYVAFVAVLVSAFVLVNATEVLE